MGLLFDLIGSALDYAAGTSEPKVKFDVCFENEDSKTQFFTLLNKWDEIFQRKDILIDPKIEKIFIDGKLSCLPPISTIGVARRWWDGHYKENYSLQDWMESGRNSWVEKNSYWNQKFGFLYRKAAFSTEGELYTSDGKSIIGFHPNDGKEPCWINVDLSLLFKKLPDWTNSHQYHTNNYSINLISYTPYGVWFSPQKGTELGFIFKISMVNHFPDGILYMYFKNSESVIDSSAILTVVGPSDMMPHRSDYNVDLPWCNEKTNYSESELGLEHLLKILDRHDIFEHLQEFLKQPYSLTEKRKQELAEQARKEAEAAAAAKAEQERKEAEARAAIERIKKEKQRAAELKAQKEKEEAERKQKAALDALNNL